jgi:hypothetical protein
MAALARRSGSRRGASTVEVALSMIMLVPLALYAIYAGESFLAATRAQEAEITASWDATAYRLHDYLEGQDYESGPDGEPSLYRDVTAAAARRVREELGQMDSYEGPGAGGQRMVISQQRLQALNCEPVDARPLMGGALLTFQAMPQSTRQFLHRGGYIGCRAEVNFSPQFMPRRLREGYQSKVDLLSDVIANGFTVCGSGNSLWGCEGAVRPGIIVLTNDWGLENGRENPVGSRDNRKYFNVGEAVYNLDPIEDSEHGIEGGLAGQQIREALEFLLDEEDKDYGDSSKFKFGFYNPLHWKHTYPGNNHGPRDYAHLTPWDDDEGGFVSGEDISQHRHPHHYLGFTNPHFNAP